MPGRLGLSAKEAAELCGLKISTFRKYVRDGVIPAATLPGNRWYRTRLVRWMDERSGMGSSTNDSNDDKDNPWNV
jgi:excisionase family DNA binding protein